MHIENKKTKIKFRNK